MEIKVQDIKQDAEYNIGRVYVQVNRIIDVGQLYKIQPTEAYLGIEAGTVRVTHIVDLPTLVDIGDDLRSQADTFASNLEDCLEGWEWVETDTRLTEQPWVVYQYSKLPGDRYCLPLEEFVEHTTHY